jgi:glycosyltransferase involved in cell wall biosynthesis
MEIEIFLIGYGILLLCLVGLGGALHASKASVLTDELISLQRISVLIPFRNEADSLPSILASLEQSIHLPLEIIFINDHSEDDGVAFLENHANTLPIRVLSLLPNKFGKKEALRTGMEAAKGDFFLTLDADVFFGPHYFSHLETLPAAQMWILPAILVGQSKRQVWQEVDLHIMNAINVGLYGLFRPVIASGANLLFSKRAFLRVDGYSSHQHISSGDDLFLLRDFRKNDMDVRLISASKFAVYTFAPKGIRAFLHQRMRWISKTTKVKDHFATSLGVIQTILSVAFYTLLGLCLYKDQFTAMLFLLSVKTGLDLLFYAPYFFRFNRIGAWCLIPAYQVIFPIYNLVLVIMIPVFRARWKGRNVVS